LEKEVSYKTEAIIFAGGYGTHRIISPISAGNFPITDTTNMRLTSALSHLADVNTFSHESTDI